MAMQKYQCEVKGNMFDQDQPKTSKWEYTSRVMEKQQPGLLGPTIHHTEMQNSSYNTLSLGAYKVLASQVIVSFALG